MAQIVKLRRSSISGQKPTNSHLQLGEIALNTTDGKAFLAVSGSLGESVQEFITTNASNTGSIYLSGSIKLQGDESISGSLLMTGSIINVDSISYNTGSNSNLYPGVRRWNSDAGTTELRLSGNNVTLQDGQEILYRVYNSTLSPITDGTPVTVIGPYQGHDSVEPAFAGGGDNTKYRVIGVATETINPAEFGFITRIGIIHDLNLSGFTLGEEVYLSQTEYGKLAHKEDLSISGRTIELGVVLDNSSTTGSLRLQIFNESGIQQNTSAEINTFTVNDTSTGIFNFGGITVATPTTFNVGTINGWIVDNATDPLKPYSKYVEYSGSNGLTTEYLTTSMATYLLLNESGSIVSQSNFPTSENRRRMIYLGKLIHSDKTTIRLAENTPDIMYSPLSQLREFLSPIRLINNGVSPTPDGANLSFSISGGYLHGFGVNYINDHCNPNVLYIPPQAVTTFQYRTQTGGTYTDVTTISPTYYDNNGVRTLIAGDPKQSTNQRIFLTSAGGILVQYGQTVYSKIEAAIAGIPSENFVTFPPIKENAILIGIVSLSIGATNLNDVTKAKFTLVGKFGETIGGTGGSISASDITLQNAYDNSTDPEIITNAILDGVTIKRGSSSDTDNLIVFKNGNDEIKSYVKATGDSLFNNSIFSGSIHVLGKITGSANFATLDNLPTLVSGSGQISFNGITDKPSLVSGSSQVSYTGLSNIPVGIISGAAQLPAGTVSGSSQVSFTGITDKPTLVSGSSQVSFTGLTDKPTLVSGSSQVSYTELSSIPAGIVSGSSQVSFTGITDKPTLVSGSSQVSYTGLNDIPVGIISGAAQLPAGTVSGSSQVSYTGLSNIPSGIISGAAQLPSGTVSGSSQVLNGTTIHSGSFFNGISVVSGSSQISFTGITDKPSLVSGSGQISFNGITDKPTLVSGSSQVSYTGLSSIPAGIVSGAVQVKSLLPAGTVSGSSQVSFTGITDKPTLVSGSVQVDITQTTGYSAFSSSISSSIGGLSSSIASTDSTQNGRLSSIEGKTGSISDLNTYTGSNNTVIGTLQTATSSLNSFTSSIHGAIEVTGSNLTVKGNFLVKGTTTIIDSTTLDIKDNIIQLNGTGATNGGLVVRDATAPNTVSGSLLWDTTNDKWIAGQVGFEDEIVLLTKNQALTNKTINATLNTLSNIPNTSLTNSSITIAGNSISLGGSITSATILTSTGVWSGSAQLPAGIVSGAAQLPVGLVSGSSQITYSGLTGIPSTFAPSAHNHSWANITSGIPAGLVSGSSQVSYSGLSGVPSGIVSGAAQLPAGIVSGAAQLPTGIVSGSSQVTYSGLSGVPAGIVSGAAQLPAGLVSGSSQVSYTGITDKPTLVSGSSQISYTGLSNIPTGIISGAAQLPSGTVSGSSQISFTGITDKPTLVSGSSQVSFTGITDKPTLVSGSSQISYTGLSNIPAGIISGASQLPSGTVSGSSQISFTGITDKPTLVSGSSQVSYTGLSNIPSGIISGSVQVDITQTTGYSTFSSSISSSIGGLSSSIASTDSTQNGRLSSIEGKTGSISDLNTYTGSNNTVIGSLQTATSSLNSFTSSIQGAIEVTGSNLTVKGDFLVKGTTTIIDSTTLDIKDNIIQLNGTGATNGGLVVRDATAPNTVSGSLLWDTTNDKWIAGQVGFEDEIVLLTKTQALTNKTINATLNTLSNIPNTSLTNSSITIAGNSISLGGTITSATILSSTGVWSGSAQMPSGVVSGSVQVKSLLPSGTVSGSSQVSYTGLSNIPSGIVSGSSQVSYTGLSNIPTGIVSGSSQVSYTGLSNIPSGIVSGSSQIAIASTSGFGSYINQSVLTTSSPTFDALTLGVKTGNGTNSNPYFDNLFSKTSDPNYAVQFGNSAQSDHATYLRFRVNARGVPDTLINVLTLAPDYATFNSEVRATSFVSNGYAVWHTGNLTNTLSNGYLPYWSTTNGKFENSPIFTDGTKIGIGTSPVNALDVNGYIRSISNTASAGTTGKGLELFYSANEDKSYINSRDRTGAAWKPMVLQGSQFEFLNGNVGIGTTSPSQKLDVQGNIAIANYVLGGGKDYGNTGNSNSATLQLYNGASGNTILNNGIYGIDFQTGGASRIFIANGGNVGIGTTNPEFSDWSSSSKGLVIDATSAGYSILKLVGTSTAKLILTAGSGANYLWCYGANPFVIAVNNVERFRISSNGNIGIGYTDRNEKFAVNGSGYFNGTLKIESGTLSSKTSANSPVTLYTLSTSSGTTIIMDYTIINAGGTAQRSGTLVCNFNSSSITYNETSTSDLGTSTSAVKMVPVISGGNVLVQSTITGTDTWTIKTSIRYF